MEEKEIWKPVVGYEGYYEVSSFGNIRSIDREVLYSNGIKHHYNGKILTKMNIRGYDRVILSRDNKFKHPQIHRLVAQAFIPNPKNLPQVNHKNEDKGDNRVDNLEWCTSEYNINYGKRKSNFSRTIRDRGQCVSIIQLSLKGDILAEYESLSDIPNEIYNRKNIYQCCKNERLSSKGFLWVFKKDKKNIKLVVQKYIKHKRKTPSYIPIVVYKTDGTLLCKIDSISKAKKQLHMGDKAIRECCNGTRTSYKNLIIKYAE